MPYTFCPARQGLGLCAAGLAVLVALTGCEEDSYHPDSEPQVLTLNEASAPDALLEVWINAYNLVPYRLVNNLIQMRSPTNTCFSGGTASPQSDGQGRVTLIVFDACEEDFGSIGERTDGQIEYTYAAGSAPISITATDYIDHLQLSPTNSQAVTFNGTIDLPNGTAWPLSYTITGNGSYTITSADGSSAADGDFDQFTVTSTPGAGSDYTSDISGGLGLPDGGGDMQVQTGSAGLSFDSSSTCPIYGEIALTAEDRSTISVLFNGADHIVVTVNGVAQPEQDCTAFLTGIGAQVSPP